MMLPTQHAPVDCRHDTRYDKRTRWLSPTVIVHLNSPRYLSKDGGKLSWSGKWVMPGFLDNVRWRVRFEWIFFFALIALALALRLGAFTQSLWHDEILTARCARVPWNAFFNEMAAHNASRPPLYYLLCFALVRLLPMDWSCRIPALFFGLASMPVFWLLARRFLDRATAWAATFLFAISPIAVTYAKEGREYSLLLLGALLGLYGLCLALDEDRPMGWVLCFIGTALSLQASFMGFLCVASQSLFLTGCVVESIMRERRNWKRALVRLAAYGACVVLGILLLVPWHSIIVTFVTAGEGVLGSRPSGAAAVQFGPAFLFAQFTKFGWGTGRGFWVCAALFATGCVWTALRRPRALWLLVAYVVGSLAPVFAYLHFSRMQDFESRYIIFILPALLIVEAQGLLGLAFLALYPLRNRFQWARCETSFVTAAIMCGVAACAFLPAISGMFIETKENWRDTCAFIARHKQTGDIVIVQPPWAQYVMEFYGQGLPPMVSLDKNVTREVRDICAAHPRVWFVGKWGSKGKELKEEQSGQGFMALFDPWAQGVFLDLRDSAVSAEGRNAATLQWRQAVFSEIRYNPLNAVWMARAYQDLGDTETARGYLDSAAHALTRWEPAPYTWAVLAESYADTGQLDKAVEAYKTCAASQTGDERAWFWYKGVGVYFKNKQYDAALKEGSALAKEFPDYALIYYVLGRCYEARKDWDNAYACFIKNAELQPNNAYALRLCGAYHLQHGKLDEAEAALKRSIELDPISYPDVYVNLAKVYSAKQNPARLKETVQKGVDATWNPGLVLLLAQILHIEGQDEERTNMLRKALEMYPDNADLKAALAGPLPKAQ